MRSVNGLILNRSDRLGTELGVAARPAATFLVIDKDPLTVTALVHEMEAGLAHRPSRLRSRLS